MTVGPSVFTKERESLSLQASNSFLVFLSIDTLRQYDEKGVLVAKRTNGKHRRYLMSDIEKLQGKQIEEGVVCIYCRVSSQDQKQHGDLERQKLRMLEYCAEKQYKVGYVIEEVCSGMNAIRPKLNQIFELAEEHKITKIVVEHSDRLAIFFIPVFERYFKSHGVEVEYVDGRTVRSHSCTRCLGDDFGRFGSCHQLEPHLGLCIARNSSC